MNILEQMEHFHTVLSSAAIRASKWAPVRFSQWQVDWGLQKPFLMEPSDNASKPLLLLATRHHLKDANLCFRPAVEVE